jgi:outer membrane protein assembly factor BamB
LQVAWTWNAPPTKAPQPQQGFFASPTVVGSRVYIGGNDGNLYVLNASTGKVVWSRFLGTVPDLTCGARGITATATVAPDPSDKKLRVYVSGADGYLYALDAATGAVRWRSLIAAPSKLVNDYYNWSSPTVIGGRIFVGIASQCDVPLVTGGVRSYRQTDGKPLATYLGMPKGVKGATVWSSVASNGPSLWVTTGNIERGGKVQGDANSILRLSANTLVRQDKWTDATVGDRDLDFGASPTLFTAVLAGKPTPMVGACNKDGTFFALRSRQLSQGPVWQRTIGKIFAGEDNVCLAAAIWDSAGQRLFVGSNATTVSGAPASAAMRRLDPATGALIWELALPAGPVVGSPTLSGGGVLAAGTLDYTGNNAVMLVDAATGQLLNTMSISSGQVFSQPVFAAGKLFVASTVGQLTAWQPAQ